MVGASAVAYEPHERAKRGVLHPELLADRGCTNLVVLRREVLVDRARDNVHDLRLRVWGQLALQASMPAGVRGNGSRRFARADSARAPCAAQRHFEVAQPQPLAPHPHHERLLHGLLERVVHLACRASPLQLRSRRDAALLSSPSIVVESAGCLAARGRAPSAGVQPSVARGQARVRAEGGHSCVGGAAVTSIGRRNRFYRGGC